MSAWELPTALKVGGHSWKVRTDFRAVLDILSYFNNPEYDTDEKWMICLDILFEDFSEMPYELYEEAGKAASEFIDMGLKPENKNSPSLMDWDKDAPIIIPAINSSLGIEVRSVTYMHWWTFLSAYMDIGDGLFSQVLSIRSKRQKGKKLEKWEQEFYKDNKTLIDGYLRKTERSEEEKNALRELFGYKK